MSDEPPWEPVTEQPEPAPFADRIVIEQAATCSECTDSIWPGERVVPVEGGYRCLICQTVREVGEQSEPVREGEALGVTDEHAEEAK